MFSEEELKIIASTFHTTASVEEDQELYNAMRTIEEKAETMNPFRKNLSKLLDTEFPCEHTLREILNDKEDVIRYGPHDESWILCGQCELAWPLFEYRLRLRVDR